MSRRALNRSLRSEITFKLQMIWRTSTRPSDALSNKPIPSSLLNLIASQNIVTAPDINLSWEVLDAMKKAHSYTNVCHTVQIGESPSRITHAKCQTVTVCHEARSVVLRRRIPLTWEFKAFKLIIECLLQTGEGSFAAMGQHLAEFRYYLYRHINIAHEQTITCVCGVWGEYKNCVLSQHSVVLITTQLISFYFKVFF